MAKKDNNIAHEKFARHYSVYSNATQAYLSAYPNAKYGSARELGSKLLTNINIQVLIEKYKEEFNEKYMHTKEQMIQKLEQAAEEAKQLGNFNTYFKAQEMIIKLLDLNPSQKVDVTSMGKQINIQLNLGNE